MEFVRVRLRTSADLEDFYSDFGELPLEWIEADGDPFYHFALLVPGDRFAAAFNWAGKRFKLLPDPANGELVFDFSNWNALACYFHDPAGNIVELVAHRGVGESGTTGRFSGRELLGFSELGLVGDVGQMARDFSELGLEMWDGTLDEPGRLAFVGEKGRTLILCPEGRGWLPTGRPAVPFSVHVELGGAQVANVRTGIHEIEVVPRGEDRR